MATTLTHGYLKPANPDTGDTFWGNLATDIQLMNDHVHDGTLGTVLPVVSQNIPHASWAAVSGKVGLYKQTVTVPTQFSYDTVEINFRLANGNRTFPTVEKVNSSSFTVYTNDNTQDYTATYSS